MSSYDRVFKNIARTAIFNDLGVRRSVLTLPSAEALCVTEWLANRTITPMTPQVWVERRPRLRAMMEHRRAALQLTNTEIIINQLEDTVLDRGFDLVNADLQCFMTDRLAHWIECVLAPNLLPQASAIFWLMRDFRNNKFIQWCISHFYEGALARQVAIFKGRVGTFDPRIVVPRLLIACALRDYDYEWSRSIEYNDNVYSMITLRIDHIRRHNRTPVWPRISDLLDEFQRSSSEPLDRASPVANPDLATLHTTLQQMGLACRREFYTWVVTVQSTGKVVAEFPNFRTLFETFVAKHN